MFQTIKIRRYAVISILVVAVFLFFTGTTLAAINREKAEKSAILENGGVEVPILMYHSLLKNPARHNTYCICPELFESDINYLHNNNYKTVNMQDLINFVYDGIKLPENPVVLTFDDGHYNNVHYAESLLKQYEMKAVISVVGQFSEEFSQSGEVNPNYSYITWEKMREISDSGVFEIQNHSYNMHQNQGRRLGAKKINGESLEEYTKSLTDDLMKLQNKLFESTGIYPTTFTYPFGAISKESDDIIKSMGFKATLSCYEGVAIVQKGKPESLYSLKRILRPCGVSSENFFKKWKI